VGHLDCDLGAAAAQEEVVEGLQRLQLPAVESGDELALLLGMVGCRADDAQGEGQVPQTG
jgi:hypothetical protein